MKTLISSDVLARASFLGFITNKSGFLIVTRFPETCDRTLLFNHSKYGVELELVSPQTLAYYCILPQEACVSAKELFRPLLYVAQGGLCVC